MISKHELVEAINETNLDLTHLASQVFKLEKRVEKLEKTACKCKPCTKKCEKKAKTIAKRGPGRPRKV